MAGVTRKRIGTLIYLLSLRDPPSRVSRVQGVGFRAKLWDLRDFVYAGFLEL